MERLIKNILGQWKIISTEDLNKAWLRSPKNSTPAKNLAESQPTLAQGLHAIKTSPRNGYVSGGSEHQVANRSIIKGMFDKMNDHAIAGDKKNAEATADHIRNFILSQPEGHIDFGHLNQLREGQKTPEGRKNISHTDMNNFFNHHLKNAKDLKEVHDKHGGLGAVESIMRSVGADGNLDFYTAHPSVHHMLDAIDLMRPDRSNRFRESSEDYGFGKVPDVKYKGDFDPALHKKVVSTFEDMLSGNTPKLHENAAVNRGLDLFKRYHGIKD
jgi:hypothetical protein